MTRKLDSLVKGLIVAILSMLASTSQGQSVSEVQQEQLIEAAKRTKLISALEAVRGKTFWYRPNRKAFDKVKFLVPDKDSRSQLPRYFQPEIMPIAKEINFAVLNYVQGEGDYYYLKLEFSDGQIGYLALNSKASLDHSVYPVIEHLYLGKDYVSDLQEYIFPRPPEEIYAEIEKSAAQKKAKQAKAEAAWKARGGVKIGMTTAQVLKSNWGKPNNINRTTTRNGTHEQWVYGGHNNLYFDNGILTAIQD